MTYLNRIVLAATVAFCCASMGAIAHAQQPLATSQADMSQGEIKKIDKDAGKLTIKHGELKNLGMPGMTMVFKARDAALLDKLKQGDKVSFVAEKVGGTLTVTAIEAAQ